MPCRFCGSPALLPALGMVRCAECGSLATDPLPSPETLAAMYSGYDGGVRGNLRQMRQETPLSAWFASIVETTARPRDAAFRWLDVGAGGGELAGMLAARYPNATGTALDWAERPADLASSVDWRVADLNGDFTAPPADLVLSISVWEHVLQPDRFVERLARLVAPGGELYLVCPDAGSLAFRVLGRRWPYYLPGEHLHLPTVRGAQRCLERLGGDVRVRRIGLPYPPAYVLGFLGLTHVAKLARRLPGLPLPVGALEARVRY